MSATDLAPNSLTDRNHYHASGAANFAPFSLWMALALAVAAVLAGLMFWLYHVGHYYIIVVPLVCALGVAAMGRLAVSRGHCRSGVVAGLAGLLLSLTLYLGSYYIGMVYHAGAEAAGRPDWLIKYIRLRLATDVVRDAHEPSDDSSRPNRRKATPGMNWFRFGLEALGTMVIITSATYRRSRKPYCETCRLWMAQETTTFEQEKASEIIQALQTQSARALAALCSTPPYTTLPNATLAIDYCPSMKNGTARDCRVFLSLKNVTANAKGITLDSFDQAKGKMIERLIELLPAELPALASRFPIFEAYAGRAAVASLLPTRDLNEEPAVASAMGELASIEPLGADHFGKVLTRKSMLIGNAFALAGLAGFLGGLLLLAWGASILEKSDSNPTARAGGGALCATGGILVLGAIAGILFDHSFGGNSLLRKKFRAELDRRTGLFVDPTDPDACFVEVVPKLNWGKVMLDNASDIGLLVVDPHRREIRFEGDKERWRVPAASITACSLESYVHGQGSGASTYYYVVLRANRGEGFWEVPLRERRPSGILSRKRKKSAQKLLAKIQELPGASPVFRQV